MARSEHAAGGDTRPAATRAPLTWREMRDRTVRMLVERTGEGVEEWNHRVAELDPPDESALRAWLTDRGVTFAVVKASTRQRVDLGLRIDGQAPEGRLQDGSHLGNSSTNLRIGLASPEDLDDEALAALRRAYQANA